MGTHEGKKGDGVGFFLSTFPWHLLPAFILPPVILSLCVSCFKGKGLLWFDYLGRNIDHHLWTYWKHDQQTGNAVQVRATKKSQDLLPALPTSELDQWGSKHVLFAQVPKSPEFKKYYKGRFRPTWMLVVLVLIGTSWAFFNVLGHRKHILDIFLAK